jgi:N-acyl-D-aspartate/D-glutamate deacylase
VPERIAALKDKATVDRLVAETGEDGGMALMGGLIIRGGDKAPAHLAGKTLGEVSRSLGEGAARTLIGLSLENDLDVAFLNADMGHDATDRIGPMLAHPLVHIGASDGGAHLASFATYGDTGYLFSEFVRKSGHLSLEHAVKKITSDTAEIWGLKNRGTLAPGWAADVVVFDPKTVARGEEHPIFDMPGDGMRYVRDAKGIDTVLVNGEVAYAQGAYTDAQSGVICS